jgi:hypothetical protein
MRQLVMQIPERGGDGAVGELAAAGDGGEAAERGLKNGPAGTLTKVSTRVGEDAGGKRRYCRSRSTRAPARRG